MTGKVADRIGLTGTGLTALTPTDIKVWLDRVRAGQMNAAEYRATLLLVYRTWLIAFFLKALGSGWDVAWHFRFNRDDFAPPHNINLVGDGIAIVLVLCHWYTRFAVDKIAFRLMVGGVLLFVASAPIDVINHRINGLDITSWSITHFGLYTGTAIMISGVIRGWRLHSEGLPSRSLMLGALWLFFLENVWFPAQHQEYGVEEIASWDRGQPYAEPSLLQFAASETRSRGRPGIPGAVLAAGETVGVPAVGGGRRHAHPYGRPAQRRFALDRHHSRGRLRRLALRPLATPGRGELPHLGGAIPDPGRGARHRSDLPGQPALAGRGRTRRGRHHDRRLPGRIRPVVGPRRAPLSYWSAPVAGLLLFAGWSLVAALRAHRGRTLF